MKFYYITEEKVKEHNLNWLRIPDHIQRKLIIRGTGTEETNSLFNWISHQNIDKIHLYIKYTKEKNLALKCLNLINNNAFWGCSRMEGGGGGGVAKRLVLPESCHTYSAKRKLCTITPYLKKTQKIYESCDISAFSSEISKFCYTKKYRYSFHYGTKFLNLLNFFWVFKVSFN